MLVASLATLDAASRVELPVAGRSADGHRSRDLNGGQGQSRRALSAPVTLVLDGKTATTLTPKQLAPMLQLPTRRAAAPSLGGAAANAYFAKLDHQVGRPAHGATFAAYGDQVARRARRSRARPRRAALGRARCSPPPQCDRTTASRASSSARSPSGRTTAAAQAMGITGLVG